jgi:ADP-ribosyltransferase exoenzyme
MLPGMDLKGLLQGAIEVKSSPPKNFFNPKAFEVVIKVNTDKILVNAIVASLEIRSAPVLGAPSAVMAACTGWIHQDDDAHDTCALTACLNPLHPGPCKGWKGNLFKVAPNAYHALEAARVEKANTNRLKKIQALKDAGKPIPKKLLQPIVAKPHPHAGKTAYAATGEAHAAGKAVSDAAGVHTSEPGKVTLGQAIKQIVPSDATAEKGPKGKKPTVASKGIAAVIAQEKVTPQYKLDKASKITPEQWAALSHDEKAIIRGELTKIQTEGFGPQQKKATELLDKLTAEKPPKIGELTPGTPGTITTPSGKTYQKLEAAKPQQPKPDAEKTVKEAKADGTLAKAQAEVAKAAAEAGPPKVQELHEPGKAPEHGPTSAGQVNTVMAISNAIPGVKSMDESATDKLVAAFDKLKSQGNLEDALPFKKAVTALATKALTTAVDDKVPGVGHGDNDIHNGTLHKEITEHILQGKPGLPPMVAKIVKHHEQVKAGDDAAQAKIDALVKAHEANPPKVQTATEVPAKLADAVETVKPLPKAEQAKPLPKHVQHAIDMANGHAPGASWSKNHLAAYLPLSAEEFHALPPDVRDKITHELHKSLDKFLDPKKKAAAQELLDKFSAKKSGEASKAPKIENVDFIKNLHDHNVTPAQAKAAVEAVGLPVIHAHAVQIAGITPAEHPGTIAQKHLAKVVAQDELTQKVKVFDPSVVNDPAVKAASNLFKTAVENLSYAQALDSTKKKAWNKANLKLELDKGKNQLSPIEKATLENYKQYLLHYPVKTDDASLHQFQVAADNASEQLNEALQKAHKDLHGPTAAEMSPAQVESKAAELLGESIGSPNVNLSVSEMKTANVDGMVDAAKEAEEYPQAVKEQPAVAAKIKSLGLALGQLNAINANIKKLDLHIANGHDWALQVTPTYIHGKPLTDADIAVIKAHKQLLYDKHAYLPTVHAVLTKKVEAAKAALHETAKAAQAPAVHTELTPDDLNNIEYAYQKAWSDPANKAVLYGVKTYSQKQEMKAHPEYAPLTQDLGQLRALSGKLAVAHAKQHTAELNVPTDPNTGAKLNGPEIQAWLATVAETGKVESEFAMIHKAAQARLDKIRTDVGLKKRALPKADAAAVKAAAAESGYYKTATYGGINYGKTAKAKNYMLAKVGPKHAVVHVTSGEKKAEQAAKAAEKKAAAQAEADLKAAEVKAKLGIVSQPKVKASVADAGTAPNPTAAAKFGFTYTPQVAPDMGQWHYSSGQAYVPSDAVLKDLQEHLAKPDIQHGLGAQKQFKWSINNMQGKGATASQRNALYSYTGSGYASVNEKLNDLPPGMKKTGSTTISNIDSAMEASPPMESDVVLYRGFKSPHSVFSSGKWNDVNVAGMEWSQRSYSSTSGALSTAQGFAGYGGVVMRVIIPKEMQVKGINAKGGQHGGENEIILQRGLRYRVVADYGKHGDGKRYIDVMVVPNPYAKAE